MNFSQCQSLRCHKNLYCIALTMWTLLAMKCYRIPFMCCLAWHSWFICLVQNSLHGNVFFGHDEITAAHTVNYPYSTTGSQQCTEATEATEPSGNGHLRTSCSNRLPLVSSSRLCGQRPFRCCQHSAEADRAESTLRRSTGTTEGTKVTSWSLSSATAVLSWRGRWGGVDTRERSSGFVHSYWWVLIVSLSSVVMRQTCTVLYAP